MLASATGHAKPPPLQAEGMDFACFPVVSRADWDSEPNRIVNLLERPYKRVFFVRLA